MPNSIVWFDVASDDLEGALAFYKDVFGWHYQDPGMSGMDYRFISASENEASVGGVYRRYDAEAPEQKQLTVYFGVDSIDDTLKKISDEGGHVIRTKTELSGGYGFDAIAADPAGNVFALFQDPVR
jgi:uncharacterized protein